MAFAAARMIKEKAKRPSMDLALYPVSFLHIHNHGLKEASGGPPFLGAKSPKEDVFHI